MKVVDTTPKVGRTFTISCSHAELEILSLALSRTISAMKLSGGSFFCGRSLIEFDDALHSINVISK